VISAAIITTIVLAVAKETIIFWLEPAAYLAHRFPTACNADQQTVIPAVFATVVTTSTMMTPAPPV
jgi:hypothetical protein